MVKITNGINVFEVTSGAYEGIYRHQGYQIVDEQKERDFIPEGVTEKVGPTADEIFVEELQKKPISQWNKDEVKRYAAVKEIDIKGTKNVNEAKEIIKKAINEGDEEGEG